MLPKGAHCTQITPQHYFTINLRRIGDFVRSVLYLLFSPSTEVLGRWQCGIVTSRRGVGPVPTSF